MPLSALFHSAGGLVYHARARRFAGSLWSPFKQALAPWLARIDAPHQKLLLVGPSAGYCIADAFLGTFREIELLEPDPLAAWLLQTRLKRLGVSRVTRRASDLLVAPLLGARPGLDTLLEREPDTTVAFCNVLGQLRFALSEPDFERWLCSFRERVVPQLSGRVWLSFHDRLSGELAPQLGDCKSSAGALDDDELVRRFYGHAPAGTRPAELLDHHTARIWPEPLPRAYFSWQLLPRRYHLIEGIASAPS